MTRLQAFAESLTEEMVETYEHGEARLVAERRIRELARAIDGDVQGPAQSYLDEISP